jgi:tetratricopeptide (TPR) repeat protein
MMKNFLLALGMLLLMNSSIAQTKTKTTEKHPAQKEMEEMMKEMQQGMDSISPEDKKAMEDMGVTLPSMNGMPKLTDQQIQDASAANERIVPERDIARIASISKVPLTNSSMPSFLSATNANVAALLKPLSRSKGEELYQLLKTEHTSIAEIGNTAAGLWMMGRAEIALYVIGKACVADPANTDNLSNFASMLSMSGAEQLAIPILDNLNKRFPGNSTILNNLGQAWFGLGDLDEATKYLDKTIRICAAHPQANFTKSFILESGGNMQGAIDAALASTKAAYSQVKENRLSKLGYDLKSDDVYWDKPMPQDPLGLEKFKWPAFPMSAETSKGLENEWDAFRESCDNELTKLESQESDLMEVANTVGQMRTKKLLEAGSNGQAASLFPPLAPKAFVKLKYLIDDSDGHITFSARKKTEAISQANIELDNIFKTYSDQIAALNEMYGKLFGEGKRNPFKEACNDFNGAISIYLSSANSMLELTQTDYLNFLRRRLNDQIYYDQYTKWPEQFELEKVLAKEKWLGSISGLTVKFMNISNYCYASEEVKPGKFLLSEFDDVHCEYHSEFKSPVGSINIDCSRMTTKLDLKVIKLGLKQDMNKETFGDQFMSCSVEVGASASAGVNLGPIKAEASVGGSLRVEIDRTGVTDVVATGSAGVSAGTDIISGGSKAGVGVSDLSVEAGVEGQVSIMSGKSSVEGTGVLSGAFKR